MYLNSFVTYVLDPYTALLLRPFGVPCAPHRLWVSFVGPGMARRKTGGIPSGLFHKALRYSAQQKGLTVREGLRVRGSLSVVFCRVGIAHQAVRETAAGVVMGFSNPVEHSLSTAGILR